MWHLLLCDHAGWVILFPQECGQVAHPGDTGGYRTDGDAPHPGWRFSPHWAWREGVSESLGLRHRLRSQTDWSRVGTRLPVLQTEKLRHGGVMPPSQAPPVSPWLTLPTLPPFIPLSLFNRVTEGLLPQTHYYMMPDSSLKMCKESFSDKYLNKQVGAGDL